LFTFPVNQQTLVNFTSKSQSQTLCENSYSLTLIQLRQNSMWNDSTDVCNADKKATQAVNRKQLLILNPYLRIYFWSYL